MDLAGLQPLWHENEVSIQAHVFLARSIAADFAKKAGFPKDRVDDIVLCVTELAQNHIDHSTKDGRIRLFGQQTNADEAFFVVSSMDMGQALERKEASGKQQAFSQAGLGVGLDTIRRISDGFGLCSGKLGSVPCPDLLLGKREFETLICASFFQPKGALKNIPVDFSYLIRPAGLSRYCGDGFFFSYEEPFFQMVVVDVMGKGKEAAKLLFEVGSIIRLIPPGTEPQHVLACLGQSLIGTRGIMAHVVRINVELPELSMAAAGDVGHFFFLDGKERFLAGSAGLVGPVNSKSGIVHATYGDFTEAMGILFTDGLRKVPKIRFNQVLMDVPSVIWTNYVFSLCEDDSSFDDATMVVWKWKA